MNKPRIFPKSTLEGSNFKTCKFSKIFICLIGYICKSSEYYSYTVYKCQQAEIILVFVPTLMFSSPEPSAHR